MGLLAELAEKERLLKDQIRLHDIWKERAIKAEARIKELEPKPVVETYYYRVSSDGEVAKPYTEEGDPDDALKLTFEDGKLTKAEVLK